MITQKVISEAIQAFKSQGYAVLRSCSSSAECSQLRAKLDQMIEDFRPTPQTTTVFDTTVQKDVQYKSQYFLDSMTRAHLFFESKAWKNGQLVVPKNKAINKIGHSLHDHHQLFARLMYSHTVNEICRQLGVQSPKMLQSMAIFKQPGIGGQVCNHQDSTYLFTDPDTLLGFWMPLQAATIYNGCLWGLPQKGDTKLYKRSKLVGGKQFQETYHAVDYLDQDFVPLQMQQGDLVFFTGRFVHRSHLNGSDRSRYALVWHLYDSSKSQYCRENWLQREFPAWKELP